MAMPRETRRGVTAADISRLCGDVADTTAAAILATGGDLAALEKALAWVAGDDEHTQERHLEPSGAAGRMYDILMQDEAFDER